MKTGWQVVGRSDVKDVRGFERTEAHIDSPVLGVGIDGWFAFFGIQGVQESVPFQNAWVVSLRDEGESLSAAWDGQSRIAGQLPKARQIKARRTRQDGELGLAIEIQQR